MLSEKEKQGLIRIFNLMATKDLTMTAATVTNHQVLPETTTEAIDMILRYSPTALSVLLRKYVRRKYIFQYLHDSGAVIPPNADKRELARTAMQTWDTDLATLDWNAYEEEPEDEMQVEITVASNQSEIQKMALAFATWFYHMLNEKSDGASQSEVFGPHHFWHDVNFQIKIGNKIFTKHGALVVSGCLSDLITRYNLKFQPNVNSPVCGISGEMDPHGLATIMVSGLVFKDSNPKGVFDQRFGLIQETVAGDTRWKIKHSQLALQVDGECAKELECIFVDALMNS